MAGTTWPIEVEDVTAWLGTKVTDERDSAARADATAAAVRWVERYGWPSSVEPGEDPGPDVRLATRMLAARWYLRRSSINGVAAFSDAGPLYVRKSDPDVAELLRLDAPGVA